MPEVIDYPDVVDALSRQGLISLYYNSGAFGFPGGVLTQTVGWIGADDSTIRPEAREFVRHVSLPVAESLTDLAAREWTEHLRAPVWLTPKSHWAYELDFGNYAWLASALKSAGVSEAQIALLARRHDGSALQLDMHEVDAFRSVMLAMQQHLFGSDFLLSWPSHPLVCTIHHHKQLWWTTTDPAVFSVLEERVPRR